MTLKIIEATEPITVEHPVVLIYSDPGIGKTSMGNTAHSPLCVDHDRGAHRSGNRKRTVRPDSWEDVLSMLDNRSLIQQHQTWVEDTVGRLLDLATLDIIADGKGKGGALSIQGWGVLKSRFATYLARLRDLGKDVVLLAHGREDKDGDSRIIRPDIQGGSYGEVMKSAEFVGYLHLRGSHRVIGWAPTEKYVGKDPAGWGVTPVPDFDSDPLWLGKMIDKGREALGRISGQSAEAALKVDGWRSMISSYGTVEAVNEAIPKVKAIEEAFVQSQVKRLLADHAKALGLTFDTTKGGYIPKPENVAPEAPETAVAAV